MGRIILVRHETDHPALYGAAAALVAAAEGGRLFWPAAQFDFDRHPDAQQHVADEGALIPSGLIWADRLTGRSARPLAELADEAADAGVLRREAVIVDEVLIDRDRIATATQRRRDELAIRFTGTRARRPLGPGVGGHLQSRNCGI